MPGVVITRWIEQEPAQPQARPAVAGPRSPVAVPDALTGLRAGRADAGSGDGAAGDATPGDVEVLIDLGTESAALPAWAGEAWRFGYGPMLDRHSARAALVDYVRAAGRTRVGLVREPAGTVIRDGWLQTGTWWRGELLDHLLMDVASWPATAILERLRAGAGAAGPAGPAGTETGDASDEVEAQAIATRNGVPDPVLVIGAVGRRFVTGAQTLVRQPDWNIGVVDAAIDGVLSTGFAPRISWLPTREGHFAADPFGVERDGVLHVLFEDYDQAAGLGSIQHVSIATDGETSEPEPVLKTAGHAPRIRSSSSMRARSSCFRRRHRQKSCPVPGGSIPRRLAPIRNAALRGARRRRIGRLTTRTEWWMFATRMDRGDNHNLFVWHSAELDGPWLAHRGNPVKTDVRSSRPGGTPFVRDGAIYRPAQDCSRVYGGRIVVNRVDRLTPDAFDERPVAVLEPHPGSTYPDGLHTLSAAGGRTLIDGNRHHFVGDAARRTLRHRLRRFRSPGLPDPAA